MGVAVALVAASVALVAAGCGGDRVVARQTTTARVVTPPHRARPPLDLRLRVVDGDTGAPVPRARLAVAGAERRGRTLFSARPRTLLSATVSAPGYEPQRFRFRLHRSRRLTVRLYLRDGQWPMYGVAPSRTQAQDAISLRPPFRVLWGRNLHALLEFPAAVDDGVAYVSNLDGTLYALSMATGRTLWQRDLRSWEQDSSPAVVGDALVVHVKAGRVLVLDRSTGAVRWSWATAGPVESSPVVLGGVDYLGDWAGNVYALDLRRRRLRWVYRDGCKITASAAVAGGTLYLGDYCGRVLALARASGRLRWSASAGSPVYGTAAVADGRVFAPSRDLGALVAFSTAGDRLWSVGTGGYVYSAPAVWRGRVYFGSYTGVLYCVSAASGRVLWTLDVGGRISGSPTVIAGVVYAASFAHRIVGADARTGRVLFGFPHGEYVAVSGNRARLLLHGWSGLWAVAPRR